MSFHDEGEHKGKWLEECVPQTWGNEAERSMESAELRNIIDLSIIYQRSMP